MTNKVSVIICSNDDARFEQSSLQFRRLLASTPFEIIRIPDAKSLSEGYNRGIAQSSGDILVFSHDDIEILADDFALRVRRHMENLDLIGICGATRVVYGAWGYAGHPYVFGQIANPDPKRGGFIINIYSVPAVVVPKIKMMDGLLFIARREAAVKLGFDAEAFDGFHGYDVDFTYRAFLAGMKTAVVTDIPVIHSSTGTWGDVWKKYVARFMAKHRDTVPPPNGLRPAWAAKVCVKTKEEVLEVMRPPHVFGEPGS